MTHVSNLFSPFLRLRRNLSETSGLALVSMVCLIAQNVALVFLMRYSRTRPDMREEQYSTMSAILVGETIKLLTCAVARAWTHPLREAVRSTLEARSLIRLAIPAMLYTFQNNLLYYSLSILDTTTFQVLYQSKILTTAFFSIVILGRRLNKRQVLSLLVLMTGIIVVQNEQGKQKMVHENIQTKNTAESTISTSEENGVAFYFFGVIAVLLASATSGFAGVLIEKSLKGKHTAKSPTPPSILPIIDVSKKYGSAPSLHRISLASSNTDERPSLLVQNMQMALIGIAVGTMSMVRADGLAVIGHDRFWYGWNGVVWAVVVVQAIGGLLVAAVVKYADSMMKTVAVSIGIILSIYISVLAGETTLSAQLLAGIITVVAASFSYASSSRPSPDVNECSNRTSLRSKKLETYLPFSEKIKSARYP